MRYDFEVLKIEPYKNNPIPDRFCNISRDKKCPALYCGAQNLSQREFLVGTCCQAAKCVTLLRVNVKGQAQERVDFTAKFYLN